MQNRSKSDVLNIPTNSLYWRIFKDCESEVEFVVQNMIQKSAAQFSLTLAIFSFKRNTLLFSFSFFFPFFFYKLCVRGFSKTTPPIYMKFLDLINIDLNLIAFFLWLCHFWLRYSAEDAHSSIAHDPTSILFMGYSSPCFCFVIFLCHIWR